MVLSQQIRVLVKVSLHEHTRQTWLTGQETISNNSQPKGHGSH